MVREYVAWCRTRYHDHAWFVDRVFGHQLLERELETLRQAYSDPDGRMLLCTQDGEVCGAGAFRAIGDGVCEMKRLFVRDRFKGQGIGRKLCDALIAVAAADGFSVMRLDTLNLMTEAIALYRSRGFRDCPPYRDYPADLAPFMVFMERPLGGSAQP